MRTKTVLLALFAAALACGEAQAEGKQDFTLVNRTGYQIDEVYIGPVDASDWGPDIMGEDAIDDGESTSISFDPRSKACTWDIRVVYNDGDATEWHKVNLCSINQVTLFWDKKAGTTRALAE